MDMNVSRILTSNISPGVSSFAFPIIHNHLIFHLMALNITLVRCRILFNFVPQLFH